MASGLILIGAPGVGKGTQAQLISERLGLVHLSSGDIFRGEIERGTDLGNLAKRYIDEGRLVPNGVVIEMMAKHLRNEEIHTKGFILDGFPRTVRQAEALDTILAELGHEMKAVIVIEVSDDEIVKRMLARGRADDTPETIRTRLETFHGSTRPVVEHYQDIGMLQRIDGDRSVEEVFSDISKILS